MRQWLGVLLALLLAGCASSETPPVRPNQEPQHALWFNVPNPLDHGLLLDTTDSFLFGVESNRDVEIRIRFLVVAPGEQVISDDTRSVTVYHAIPAEVRLPVLHPYEVPAQTQRRLALRVRVHEQSVTGTVQVRITALGLTISDPTRQRQMPSHPPAQPVPVTEGVYK